MAGFAISTNFRQGAAGKNAWSPLFAIVALSATIDAFKLTGWTGGEGTAPTANIGQYLGANGFTADPLLATNVKGVSGSNGSNGDDGSAGWTPSFAIEIHFAGTANEKVVMKVIDFIGGTGTKPTVPVDAYVTATGYGTLANAINIQGNKGNDGNNGWIPRLEPVYRTPIEVVMQVTDYYGGTGPNPYDNVDPLLTFVGTAGDLVAIAQAKRINPEDSLDNRLQNIKSFYQPLGINTSDLQVLINSTKDCLAWIATNTGTEFSQVDALSVFKMSMRNIMYLVNRGTASDDLPTFPAGIVSPILRAEIENIMVALDDTQIGLFQSLTKDFFRAICDFDGEIEARYILGDVDDTYTAAELSELASVFDWFATSMS